MHVFTCVLCWICYLAQLLYKSYNFTTCISFQSPSCTWHTHLQQTKPSPRRFPSQKLSTMLEATGLIIGTVKLKHRIFEQLICVTYRHCFLTASLHCMYAMPKAIYIYIYMVIVLSDICRLPLPIGFHSSDFPPAWRNNSGKWQTIVVRCTDLFTTTGHRRYLCVWFHFRD